MDIIKRLIGSIIEKIDAERVVIKMINSSNTIQPLILAKCNESKEENCGGKIPIRLENKTIYLCKKPFFWLAKGCSRKEWLECYLKNI